MRLEVAMDNAKLMESVERNQEISGELDHEPWRQSSSVVLEDDLSDIVLKQLQHKEGVISVLQCCMAGDNVVLWLS